MTLKVLPNVVLVGCPEVTVPFILASKTVLIFFLYINLYLNLVMLFVKAFSTYLYSLYGNSVVLYIVGNIFLHKLLSTISNKQVC